MEFMVIHKSGMCRSFGNTVHVVAIKSKSKRDVWTNLLLIACLLQVHKSEYIGTDDVLGKSVLSVQFLKSCIQ